MRNGRRKIAERVELPGGAECPGTDEMPYLAKMLCGRIEVVDLENPETAMITCGVDGPTLFRIPHSNIAEDNSYVCELWTLISTATDKPTHAEGAKKDNCSSGKTPIMVRLHGKRKPCIALGKIASGMHKTRNHDRKTLEGYTHGKHRRQINLKKIGESSA